MSTEIDFKSLWNKQEVDTIPDTRELFKKADTLKKTTRNKLIRLNLLLLAVAVYIAYIGFHIDNEKLTTKIGLALVVIALLTYLVAYNFMLPLLFKTNPLNSSQEYLQQLLRIKRKQEFLNTVMINIYFALFTTGMTLYMLQFVMMMTTIAGILSFTLIIGWILFAWFYLRPRGIIKKQKPLNDLIAKLEEVTGQLNS